MCMCAKQDKTRSQITYVFVCCCRVFGLTHSYIFQCENSVCCTASRLQWNRTKEPSQFTFVNTFKFFIYWLAVDAWNDLWKTIYRRFDLTMIYAKCVISAMKTKCSFFHFSCFSSALQFLNDDIITIICWSKSFLFFIFNVYEKKLRIHFQTNMNFFVHGFSSLFCLSYFSSHPDSFVVVFFFSFWGGDEFAYTFCWDGI